MTNHGLSQKHLTIIRDILSLYADKIDTVGLFGSRAQGTHRNNSDIDIVLYGSINEREIDRIFTLFDESNLPVSVDITAYHLINYPPLKTHIDACMQPIFTTSDLRANVA